MNTQTQRVYRLDDIEIDPSRLSLKRGGEERHLRQQTFQVLIYLLEQRERLVIKDELINYVWRDTAVTDNALEQCLAEIRKVLGDDSRHPRFIKTVPRAGYRFIGAVEEVSAQPSVAAAVASLPAAEPESIGQPATVRRRWFAWRSLVILLAMVLIFAASMFFLVRRRAAPASLVGTTLPQDPAKRPVAVMFFDNQSASADLDWLREGLADMIITDLSRSRNITVLSRQQLYVLLNRAGHKAPDNIQLDEAIDIARQSHAKIFVLGSFVRLGDQIRIDVHLHDSSDGQLLTAERVVVENPAQILTQVDLLSLKLAAYIGSPNGAEATTNLSTVMTNNLEAYRNYSLGVEKAQFFRNEEAIALLEKAIELDPNFAVAYARIGYVYAVRVDAPEKARHYLEKSYQLAGRLTEKDKLEIAAWYAIANFDFPTAINSCRQIISNYPLEVEAYWLLANLLRGEERIEEGIEIAKQGLAVDAGAKELYNYLGLAYSDRSRHDEAITMFRRYVELAPDEPNAYDSLGLGLEWSGRYPEAVSAYERALSLKPDFLLAIIHLGNTYFQQGKYRQAVQQYERYLSVGTADLDRARAWSSIAFARRKMGKLAEADQAARQQIRYYRDGAENLLLLALDRGDRATAEKYWRIVESRQALARGARSFSRDQVFCRGYFELRTGNPDKAIESFQEAIKHLPLTWNIDAYEDCLANAYLELGRFDEAISEYERILKLNPNYPLVHYHLAQAYEHKGQQDRATAEYREFLDLWKDADSDIPEIITAKQKVAGR